MRYDYHMFEFDWQKILLWAGFIFLLGALLLRQEAGINQDLGRHLRLGEMIVAGGEQRKCALYSNCLTYTYPDYPFVNHHWGSEVIFYLIYKLGGFGGLILLKTLVFGAAFGITAFHALYIQKTQNTQKARTSEKSENQRIRSSDSPTFRLSDTSGSPSFPSILKLSTAMILTFFSINMMADRLTTRPEIFGYLLFSILFWILDKKDLSNWRNLPNWMLIPIIPILMIIWVNLHISFVFGLILIWLWTISRILKGPTLPRQGRTLILPIISTLITLANPAGLRGALMPFSIMKDYGYTIVENMTPFFLRAFKPQPEYWIYATFLVVTTIMVIASNKRPSIFSILSFYVFSIFPLIAVRHLAFFALTAVVALSRLLQGLTFASAKVRPYGLYVAGGLLLASLMNPVPLAYAKLPTVGLTVDRRHEAAVKFVKDHDLQGKMWNNYDIGSFLEWSLPEYPTFVDGRPEAFPVGFLRGVYIRMQESREKWDEMAQTYDIQWAFVALTDATPWFRLWWQMIKQHPDWKIVYFDNFSAVLVKVDSQNNLIGSQGKAKILELLQ